jgi:hypothetical protein
MFTGKHREGADRLVAAAAPFGLMRDLIAQGQAQGGITAPLAQAQPREEKTNHTARLVARVASRNREAVFPAGAGLRRVPAGWYSRTAFDVELG